MYSYWIIPDADAFGELIIHGNCIVFARRYAHASNRLLYSHEDERQRKKQNNTAHDISNALYLFRLIRQNINDMPPVRYHLKIVSIAVWAIKVEKCACALYFLFACINSFHSLCTVQCGVCIELFSSHRASGLSENYYYLTGGLAPTI